MFHVVLPYCIGVIWPTTQGAANLKISQAWLTDDDHHHNSIIALTKVHDKCTVTTRLTKIPSAREGDDRRLRS